MSSDDLTTQPMLNTILERLNEIAAKFTDELEAILKAESEQRSEMDFLRKELGAILKAESEQRSEMDFLRREMEAILKELGAQRAAIAALETAVDKGFRSLDRRLEVISSDIIKLRADFGYIEDRVEKLEQRPS